ncbi:MAG TPA: hypothetical protein IAA30_02035 [Candidatus Treponema faecavium]|nr:hypothetical protein [Candidatus Treponema faecavium]
MQHFFVNVKSQIPHPDTKHGAGIYFFIDKQSVNNIERNRKNTAAFAQRRTPRSEPAKKKNTGRRFADCKISVSRLSGKKFAIGQRRTCRLQIFSLPTANRKFAVGKCAAGHRQNSCLINGKIKFSRWQILGS